MIRHISIENNKLVRLVKTKNIRFGGNAKLKIYGTLDCRSGKRMKRDNRVFFASAAEAIATGYRPCGNCMRTDYLNWKDGLIQS
jgi:methylphosphotriester-DNA--protein-cysteine methyltransferase